MSFCFVLFRAGVFKRGGLRAVLLGLLHPRPVSLSLVPHECQSDFGTGTDQGAQNVIHLCTRHVQVIHL